VALPVGSANQKVKERALTTHPLGCVLNPRALPKFSATSPLKCGVGRWRELIEKGKLHRLDILLTCSAIKAPKNRKNHQVSARIRGRQRSGGPPDIHPSTLPPPNLKSSEPETWAVKRSAR
jgi:hypothetical protein